MMESRIMHGAFHQELHCALRKSQSSEKIHLIILQNITYCPSLYIMEFNVFKVENGGSINGKCAPSV